MHRNRVQDAVQGPNIIALAAVLILESLNDAQSLLRTRTTTTRPVREAPTYNRRISEAGPPSTLLPSTTCQTTLWETPLKALEILRPYYVPEGSEGEAPPQSQQTRGRSRSRAGHEGPNVPLRRNRRSTSRSIGPDEAAGRAHHARKSPHGAARCHRSSVGWHRDAS